MKAKKDFLGLPQRWRLIDQPLKKQFLTAAGVFAILTGGAAAILIFQVQRQFNASQELTQIQRNSDRIRFLSRDLYRQQTLLLEFLRTRNPDLSTDYEKISTDTIARAQSLENDLAPDTDLQGLIAHLSEAMRSWGRVSADLKTDPSKLGVESTLAHETFLTLDRIAERYQEYWNRAYSTDRKIAHETRVLIFFELIGLFFVFLGLMSWMVATIVGPLVKLAEGVERYQTGEFSLRHPVQSQSEMGFLQAGFNEFADKTEAMIMDLKRLDEMKTDFVSTVSHELRTPLTSIGGYAKLLLSHDAGELTPTQREFLDIIDKNVDRLTHLINDILDVEKMESGHVQIVREPQDIVPVLREVKDTLSVLAIQKGLEVRFKVPPQLKNIMGERRRLVQIFMNLLSNAIKYTERGFVEIEAEEKDFAIVVRIRDSGIGISNEEQESLFRKFYRTRSGLSSAESGTGLGLVIARGLVQAHGGTIRVESAKGKGTTFVVALPVAVEEFMADSRELEEAPVSALVASVAAKRPRSVWIIDGQGEAVAKMQHLFESESRKFDVGSVRISSYFGLDRIPEKISAAPSLIIVDPETVEKVAGVSDPLIPALRKRLRKKVPILVVSETMDAATAFAEGASGLLTKPIDTREFLIAVRDLIAHPELHVLIVDSNPDIRILLKRSFEQLGIRADDLDRGNTVLSRLEQEQYDLVLLDSNLTDVSADELLKVIRREAEFKNLPVFVMLDEGDTTVTQAELLESGATRIVSKKEGTTSLAEELSAFLAQTAE